MVKTVKVSQILTCSGLQQTIDSSDSVFAITQIDQDRKVRIAAIKAEADNLNRLLKDSSLQNVERNIYTRALALVPERISRENTVTDAIIKHIERATK